MILKDKDKTINTKDDIVFLKNRNWERGLLQYVFNGHFGCSELENETIMNFQEQTETMF